MVVTFFQRSNKHPHSTSERPSPFMGLRHWDPSLGRAHISNVHSLGSLSAPHTMPLYTTGYFSSKYFQAVLFVSFTNPILWFLYLDILSDPLQSTCPNRKLF